MGKHPSDGAQGAAPRASIGTTKTKTTFHSRWWRLVLQLVLLLRLELHRLLCSCDCGDSSLPWCCFFVLFLSTDFIDAVFDFVICDLSPSSEGLPRLAVVSSRFLFPSSTTPQHPHQANNNRHKQCVHGMTDKTSNGH